MGVRNLIPENEFQLILKGTESDVIKVVAIFNPHILNLNIQHTNLMCRNFQSCSYVPYIGFRNRGSFDCEFPN